jgi:rare lipoprotein A
MIRALRFVLLVAIGLVGCASSPRGPTSSTVREVPHPDANVTFVQEGKATWYGREQHGGPTASGERFDMNALTAAHKTIKMNTRVRVTNLNNGRSVVVRINDRGPYAAGRIIDVSRAAAKVLEMIDRGVVPVRIEALRD